VHPAPVVELGELFVWSGRFVSLVPRSLNGRFLGSRSLSSASSTIGSLAPGR